MNEIVKQKWVAALRSGEFQQCRGTLRKGDSYCCLGVLSELAVRDGVISPAAALPETDWRANRGEGETVFAYDNEAGHLPAVVAEWAGLTYDYEDWMTDEVVTEPDVDPSVNGKELSGMNDYGSTFTEIADLIEEHL